MKRLMPIGLKQGRRARAIALVTIMAGALSAAPASPAAAEDTCANAALRAQTNSTGLPDCRAYEMVSQPYKEGYAAKLIGFTDDGVVSYATGGNIAGNEQGPILFNPYHATRSGMGWTTTPLAPPSTFTGDVGGIYVAAVDGESVDLRRRLTVASRRDVPGDPLGYWIFGADGGATRVGDAAGIGPVPFFVGGSDDLSHVVFQYGSSGSVEYTALWEYVGTGNSGPPRAVTVDNQGQPSPFQVCPIEVSDDGRVIVYRDGCGGQPTRLAARVGGAVKVAVSRSECTRSAEDVGGVCNGFSPAEYAGGAADGSRVFFTTDQQLVNGDVDSTRDLYACDIPAGVPAPVGVANPCASLTQVSGTASDAQVDNVVAVSRDGSRVYFVAQGVLADNLGLGDVGASAGAPNLYVWERDSAHPAGQTRFVARLGVNDLTRAQMTPNGRYLLFLTANSLVTTGPTADTDGAIDAYRYDATTKAVVRVSTSVSGGGGNTGHDVSINDRSSMTSDGAMAVFNTAEGLSGSDTNGVTDVYAWRDGHVWLISPGGASASLGSNNNIVWITPSGRDIFFTTQAPVLSADGDVNNDIYTARVGGGFEPAQTPSPCSGDQCQGQRSQPPGLAAPAGRGSGLREPVVAPSAVSLRAMSAAQRRTAARTGVLSLLVKSSSAGRLTAIASAKFKGRNRRVAMASPVARKAGTVKIRLRLSPAARKWLRSGRPLRVEVSLAKEGAKKRSSSVRLPGAPS